MSAEIVSHLVFLLALPALATEPRFTIISHVPNARSALGTGLTQDGSVVVGSISYQNGRAGAFRYNVLTGRLDVIDADPSRPGLSNIQGTSSNGEFFAGFGPEPNAIGGGAVRIRPGAAPDYIGTMLGDRRSVANSISGDGGVVVGQSINADGVGSEPFRWTPQTGRQSLSSLFGVRHGDALDVSRDGSTIVGYSANAGLYTKPFRWTTGAGMEELPTLTGEFARSVSARAVSADGRIIVGENSAGFSGTQPVRWIDGVIEPLPLLADVAHPITRDVDDSGGLAVGFAVSLTTGDWTGLVWVGRDQVFAADEFLRSHGVDVPGVEIARVWSVSGDGLTVAGDLVDGRPFVASIPASGNIPTLAAALLMLRARRRRK